MNILKLILLPYAMGWLGIFMLSLIGDLGEPFVPLFSVFGIFLIWVFGGMLTMALIVLKHEIPILWYKIR